MAPASFSAPQPRRGESIDDLETPLVYVDLDILEENLDRYASLAAEHDVSLRTHTKAHKCSELAKMQQDRRPDGVLCQKLGEAEVMIRAGIEDILLVVPVVTEVKLDRLCWLAAQCRQFAMLVDSPANIDPLNQAAATREQTIPVVIEIDTGLNRMGVPFGKPAAELASYIEGCEAVELHGILGHDAQLPFLAEDEDHLQELCADTATELGETATAIADETGTESLAVTTGASATAPYMAQHATITELDPGRYLFNDVDILERAPHVSISNCALRVVTTVVSKPSQHRAICNAGSKTFSYIDQPRPRVVGHPDVDFVGKSSEHGHLELTDAAELTVGDRLECIVPNAYGPINIRETLPGVRAGTVETLWNIDARGMDK